MSHSIKVAVAGCAQWAWIESSRIMGARSPVPSEGILPPKAANSRSLSSAVLLLYFLRYAE